MKANHVNIDITNPGLKKIAGLVNQLLADEYVLYTKTRNAHWNIQGSNFMELHSFFQTQYEALFLVIDDVAERVRTLGHFALGSLKSFLKVTNLKEEDHDFSDQKIIIQALIDDHEAIVRFIRTDIVPVTEEHKDLGTTDFVTSLLEKHEKMAWMLRAYIN